MTSRRPRSIRRKEEREARQPRPQARRPSSKLAKYIPIVLPVGGFVVLVGLIIALYPWVVKAGWFQEVVDFHAWAFGGIFGLLGEETSVKGDLIVSSKFAFKIVPECTSLVPSLIFASAVAVFPMSLRLKLYGIALGVLALMLVNLLRIMTLMYIAKFSPSLLEPVHLIIWQGLMVLIALGLWLLWLSYTRKYRHA